MDPRSFRWRWGWLAVMTALLAFAGAWLTADAQAAGTAALQIHP